MAYDFFYLRNIRRFKKTIAYRLRDLHLISEEIFLSLELDKEKKEAMTICCNKFNGN